MSASPAAEATMRAAIKIGDGPEVEVRSIPRPRTGPGYALVEVTATGICGTDVHIIRNEFAHEPPVVLGHEVTGEVVEVGDGEDEHWHGRRVACETYFSTCAACPMCRTGRANLCTQRRSIGSFENGGFAELLLVPVRNLRALPEHLEPEEGALIEPLACVTHCLLDPPVVQPGDSVLVTGPGTMGILAAQVARAGGGTVVLTGLPSDEPRLRTARELGITTSTDPVDAASFDVVIECSGRAGGARTALEAAARGARYVQVGIFGTDVTLPMDLVLYKELTVTSGFASTPGSWRSAIRLLSEGLVRLGPLITRRVPLEDFAEAVAAAERGEGLKTVVVPGDGASAS